MENGATTKSAPGTQMLAAALEAHHSDSAVRPVIGRDEETAIRTQVDPRPGSRQLHQRRREQGNENVEQG